MAQITEVAPDVFRITTFVQPFNLQFSQFLVRDEEPLLFHTGPRMMFPAVKEAVASLIEPARLRWIAFSHFEADECGTLPEWQTLAPQSLAVCSLVGKLVSVDDCLALRPAKGLADGEIMETGRYRFRFLATPHVPHCWEAGLLFEETHRTLLCSDLFHQLGDVLSPTSSADAGRCCSNTSKDRLRTTCRTARSPMPRSSVWRRYGRRLWPPCMDPSMSETEAKRFWISPGCFLTCWVAPMKRHGRADGQGAGF